MKPYEEPTLNIIHLKTEDIVLTSGGPFSLNYGDNNSGVNTGSVGYESVK